MPPPKGPAQTFGTFNLPIGATSIPAQATQLAGFTGMMSPVGTTAACGHPHHKRTDKEHMEHMLRMLVEEILGDPHDGGLFGIHLENVQSHKPSQAYATLRHKNKPIQITLIEDKLTLAGSSKKRKQHGVVISDPEFVEKMRGMVLAAFKQYYEDQIEKAQKAVKLNTSRLGTLQFVHIKHENGDTETKWRDD